MILGLTGNTAHLLRKKSLDLGSVSPSIYPPDIPEIDFHPDQPDVPRGQIWGSPELAFKISGKNSKYSCFNIDDSNRVRCMLVDMPSSAVSV